MWGTSKDICVEERKEHSKARTIKTEMITATPIAITTTSTITTTTTTLPT